MDDDEMAHEMLAEMGITESGLDQLARVGFDTLGLQTYLTAGPKEARAWTIPKGATAPEAAGVIHTDFQRGFIKAEIVSYDDLVAAGSMAEAKARGCAFERARDVKAVPGGTFHTPSIKAPVDEMLRMVASYRRPPCSSGSSTCCPSRICPLPCRAIPRG